MSFPTAELLGPNIWEMAADGSLPDLLPGTSSANFGNFDYGSFGPMSGLPAGSLSGANPGTFKLAGNIFGGSSSSGDSGGGTSGGRQAAQGIGGVLGNIFGGPAGGAIASAGIGLLGGIFGQKAAGSQREAARRARKQQEKLLEKQYETAIGADIASKVADFNLQSLGAKRKFDIMNTPAYMNVAGRELGGRIAERGTYGSSTPALAGRFAQMFYG